jgi:hypothetical protein
VEGNVYGHRSGKGAEDLGDNVGACLTPGEVGEGREREGDGRVDVSPGDGAGCIDSQRDAYEPHKCHGPQVVGARRDRHDDRAVTEEH